MVSRCISGPGPLQPASASGDGMARAAAQTHAFEHVCSFFIATSRRVVCCADGVQQQLQHHQADRVGVECIVLATAPGAPVEIMKPVMGRVCPCLAHPHRIQRRHTRVGHRTLILIVGEFPPRSSQAIICAPHGLPERQPRQVQGVWVSPDHCKYMYMSECMCMCMCMYMYTCACVRVSVWVGGCGGAGAPCACAPEKVPAADSRARVAAMMRAPAETDDNGRCQSRDFVAALRPRSR